MVDPIVGPAVPGVTEATVDDQACLHSPTTGQVLMLNQTASDVWFLCDGSLRLSEVVERLAVVYSVPAAQISADVTHIVDQFYAAGLLCER